MLVEAPCPRCQTTISFDSAFVGTKRACSTCGASFTLERPSKKSPSAPAADTRDGPVMFEATCPSCSHSFTVNATFAGTPRGCPKCSQVFVLTLPDAVKAQLDARKARLFGNKARDLMGCPSCLRFGPVLRSEILKTFRCQYCATNTPLDEARDLGQVLETLESKIIGQLLAGASGREIFALAGARAPLAQTLFERLRPTLGTLRKRALEAKNRGENIVLRAPADCDGCRGGGPLDPFTLLWARIEEESAGVHAATALTVFAGVLVTEKRRVVSHLEQVVYLCGHCQRSPPPPSLGYTLEKAFALPPLDAQ